MNTCLYCNEPIQADAALCDYCERDIENAGYSHVGRGIVEPYQPATIVTIKQANGRMTSETAAGIGKAFRQSRTGPLIIIVRRDQNTK